jgi:hypothetical protein
VAITGSMPAVSSRTAKRVGGQRPDVFVIWLQEIFPLI